MPQQESELESHHEHAIEMAFSKLKAYLRRICARTIDDLWRAVGSICDLYSPEECGNNFAAAGYGYD